MSIQRAIDALADAKQILVYTGAGISTDSGIPDFRGPDGLWTRVDPKDFTIDHYLTNPQRRIDGWRMHADGELWGARSEIQPNPGHLAVTELWSMGRSSGVITQNVDGLHLLAGLPRDAVSEIHGNVRRAVCVACRHEEEIEAVLERVDSGEPDPDCRRCSGLMKPATVMFGEMLPLPAISRAQQFCDEADAVLVIGSTMSVYPAAGFPLEVRARNAPMVIINQGRTDHDDVAHVLVDGSAAKVTPLLVAGLSSR